MQEKIRAKFSSIAYIFCAFIKQTEVFKNIRNFFRLRGAFFNYVDKIFAFFDHLPPYVDIFYLVNVDKKVNIFGLPTHLFLST